MPQILFKAKIDHVNAGREKFVVGVPGEDLHWRYQNGICSRWRKCSREWIRHALVGIAEMSD
jgi:hypothetical protein